MKFTVNNRITVEYFAPDLLNWCKENLVLDNPEYQKKERMGLWVGSTPRKFALYSVSGDYIYLPFGCLDYVWQRYGKHCKFERRIADLRQTNYHSNINLYPYQAKAVEAVLKAKNGILVAPCGSGKTNMGMEIISRIGGRALWLTHTQDLLNQSLSRAKSVLDTSSTYGRITAGKVDIGTGITFATVQTLSKIDLSEYRDAWDIIIVDECQHCCGSPTRVTQFYKVVSSLSARYKIGLTATPKRADGLEQSMFALLGGIIHEVSREDVKHTTCPVKVQTIETGYQPDYDVVLMGDGTINYSKLVDDMIEDESRFMTVYQAIADVYRRGSVLVLANRVNYIQELNNRFNEFHGKSICLSTLGTSKKAKEVRKEALRKLNDGEIDCIFASYKLASEGLDCPNLRYIVLATPEKDSTIIEQSTGRVARKADGKECGTVIDFVDDFGMYKSWYKKRLAIYNRLKYEVME